MKRLMTLITFSGISIAVSAAADQSSSYTDMGLWAYNRISDKLKQYREDRSRWDSMIRKFRQDHNLSAVAGVGKARWNLGAFNDPEESDASHYYMAVQYCFHLPIYKRFGYFLGSSFGFENQQVMQDEVVTTQKNYDLPGLIVGLVWNLNSYSRITSSLKGNLLRVEGLKVDNFATEPKNTYKSDQTGRSFGYNLAFDIFLKLEWGLRFEGEVITTSFHAIKDAPEHSILAYDFSKTEQRYGIGLVYHMI
jgi:hypothetical protein